MSLLVNLFLLAASFCLAACQMPSNFMKNPDFEENLLNWYCVDCEAERSIDAYEGVYSAHVFNRGVKTEGLKQSVKVIRPNRRYYAEGRIKLLNRVDVHHRVELYATLRSGGGEEERVLVAAVYGVRPEDGWVHVHGDFMSSPDTKDALIMLYVSDTEQVNFLLDAFSLSEIRKNPRWLNEANERIDKYRKSNVHVKVSPGSYNPDDLIITIEQTKRSFPFGAAVDAKMMYSTDNRSVQYQNYFYSMFNWAVLTNAMKWRMMEPVQGKPHFKMVDRAIAALNANGVTNIRGHCLAWAKERKVLPWMKKQYLSGVLKNLKRRVNYMMNRYKSKIQQWDVDNELLHGDWYERTTGNRQIAESLFHQAKQLDPQALLMTNDYDIIAKGTFTSAYKRQVSKLIGNGVPVGAIGIQNHMNVPPDVDLVKHRLDGIASLGLPLWITEMDVQDKNVAKRAMGYKNILTLLYSHPAVDGILLWGFWNGTIYSVVDSSLVDGDNFEENKAGIAVRELMQEDWMTRIQYPLGSGSQATFRGFHGNYDVTVRHGSDVIYTSTFELAKNKDIVLDIDLDLKAQDEESTRESTHVSDVNEWLDQQE